jgi:hypothetical protein
MGLSDGGPLDLGGESAFDGLRPSFSAHVRSGERGAPVQGMRLAVGRLKTFASSETSVPWQRCQISRLFPEGAQGAQVINLSILPC